MGFFRRSREAMPDFKNDPKFHEYVEVAGFFNEVRDELHTLVRSGEFVGQVADKWRGRAVLAMAFVSRLIKDPEMAAVFDRVETDFRNSEVVPVFASVRREEVAGIGLADPESAADALRTLAGIPNEPWDSRARHDYRRLLVAGQASATGRMMGSAPNEAFRELVEDFTREVVLERLESGDCGESECPHCQNKAD